MKDNEIRKVMIVGCGVVGTTIADSIDAHGHRVAVRIDPKFFTDTIEDHSDAHAAIICLPTPTWFGEQDATLIFETVIRILKCNPKMPIMIKSTVLPDVLSLLPPQVVYSPEFLREAHAFEDFENQPVFIIGTDIEGSADVWHDIFYYLHCDFEYTDRATASMIKYMHNSWLAMKVAFFHSISKLDNIHPSFDYNRMTKILGKFDNIGKSHMAIPNPDKLGYGGACFPKDVNAFTNFTGNPLLATLSELNDQL